LPDIEDKGKVVMGNNFFGDGKKDELVTWDFRLGSNYDEGRFELQKRANPNNPYRILGSEPQSKQRNYNPAPKNLGNPENAVRRNSYNSSVTVFDRETPAPWEVQERISYFKMPVMGEVAAGLYDVTVAYYESGYGADADFVMLDTNEVKLQPNSYALRVRGTSMIDNEIEHGDIIIVTAQNWANDGDFVIACLTDSDDAGFVTLKRFYRNKYGDRVVLQPANQQLSPIHIFPRKGDKKRDDLDGVKIQGRVTAIIKPSR
jgi:SOS-response transcriptional repressor LexA